MKVKLNSTSLIGFIIDSQNILTAHPYHPICTFGSCSNTMANHPAPMDFPTPNKLLEEEDVDSMPNDKKLGGIKTMPFILG